MSDPIDTPDTEATALTQVEEVKAEGEVQRAPGTHSLANYAQELQGAARQLKAMTTDAYAKNQDTLLASARNHLHEAGQWLEKAAIVLRKAGA